MIYRLHNPFLLLLLPLLWWLLWRYTHRIASMSFAVLPSQTTGKPRGLWMYAVPVLRMLALTCLCLAFARPQAGLSTKDLERHGVDILMAVDISRSMTALDFKQDTKRVTRLHTIKQVVSSFIDKRPFDRIGMVAFGERAFVQCPLTHDHSTLRWFLDRLEPGIAGDGTALGDGLGLALRRIKDLPQRSKMIILLTDGESNSGQLTPEQSAQLAKTLGVKVYTIGVGKDGEVPFMVDSVFGKRLVYQQVKLDEETLQQIADTTGARYFHASDKQSLEEIYDAIDTLEKRADVKEVFVAQSEMFYIPLMLGLGLLLLELVLNWVIFRKVP